MDGVIFVLEFLLFWLFLAWVFMKLGFMEDDRELLRKDREKNKRKS